MYGHIGLTRWPFPVVPERKYCTFVADRAALQHDLEPLMRNLIRQSTSTIHLIWSWFGAGKTHTLYYIANKSAEATKDDAAFLVPVVTEFPRGARSFLDVYRSFAVAIDPDVVTDAYLEVVTSPAAADDLRRKLVAASPDLMTALHVMATGDATTSSIALRWLRGDNLSAQTFRAAGITQKISSSEDAIRIFAALNRLFDAAAALRKHRAYRIIWMIDEFQRIERLSASVRGDINTGLHSVFNACPTGFSLFLSFSGRPRQELPDWFSLELRDRIGRTKVMVLPPLSKSDGMRFVQDVLANFRTLESYGCSPYFPFSEEACIAILEEVEESEDLKPRAIMHAFGAVLQEAEPLMERHEIPEISATFARKVLKEYVTLAVPEDTQA
jgi:hypothetical protein